MARKAKTFGSATPKKMAVGGATKSGSSSASKSTAAKGAATPASKSGSSAAGKTMSVSAAQKSSALANAKSALTGGSKFTTVTDPKTGMSYANPSYRGMSVKGLTSSDPANVARNRAAAANYAAIEAARGPRSDSSERMAGSGGIFSGGPFGVLLSGYGRMLGSEKLAALHSTNPKAAAALGYKPPVAGAVSTQPRARGTYTPMPAGYNPAVQGEWNFYQPKPTVTLAKGGKVKSKRKK
jgi:hypothetical protein